MASQLAAEGRKLASRIVALQVLTTFISSLLAFLLAGSLAGYSALLGGVCVFVPNAVFSVFAFKKAGARAANEVVLGFFSGEALKFALTIILLALVFQSLQLRYGVFFTVYILVLATAWVAPLFLQRH